MILNKKEYKRNSQETPEQRQLNTTNTSRLSHALLFVMCTGQRRACTVVETNAWITPSSVGYSRWLCTDSFAGFVFVLFSVLFFSFVNCAKFHNNSTIDWWYFLLLRLHRPPVLHAQWRNVQKCEEESSGLYIYIYMYICMRKALRVTTTTHCYLANHRRRFSVMSHGP